MSIMLTLVVVPNLFSNVYRTPLGSKFFPCKPVYRRGFGIQETTQEVTKVVLYKMEENPPNISSAFNIIDTK